MPTRVQTIARVRNILEIRGTNEILTDAQIGERVDDALSIYSKHRSRQIFEEYQGNGQHEFALPASWVDEFSTIISVELEGGGQIRTFVDMNDIEIVEVDTTSRTLDNVASGATSVTLSTVAEAVFFRDGEIVTISDTDASETNWITADGNTTTGVATILNAADNLYDSTPVIRKQNHITFRADEPDSAMYFIVEYAGRHIHNGSDTIPINDYEAFSHLSSSVAAESIADHFAKLQETGFSADAVIFGDKPDEWRAMAVNHLKIYNNHMGIIDDKSVIAVGMMQDLDPKLTWRRQFLFHGGRAR